MEAFFSALRKGISAQRLDAYPVRGVAPQSIDLYSHYLWNVALCESLYPVLQTLEIVLRNGIHNSATKALGTQRWYESGRGILQRDEISQVDAAKLKIQREGRQPDPGRVVSAVTFGFWTIGMMKRCYEVPVWHQIINDVFPAMPSRQRTRRRIAPQLEIICKFRNRVFHHEPIWFFADLKQRHQAIVDMIGFINPQMQHFVSISDKFHAVYDCGPGYHAARIRSKLRDLKLVPPPLTTSEFVGLFSSPILRSRF